MMNRASTKPKWRLRWYMLLLIGVILCLVSFSIDGALRFTDRRHGIGIGIFFTMLFLPFVFVLQGLLSFSFWMARDRPSLRKWRTPTVLAPPVILAAVTLYSLITVPPTASARFERLILSPIPDSVTNLQSFHGGGGPAADLYLVQFDIDPSDFDDIRRSHSFSKFKYNEEHWFRETFEKTFPSSLDYDSMEGRELYVARSRTQWSYAYILTDKHHRRIYFFAGRV